MYVMTSGSESNSISNARCSSASGTRLSRSVCSVSSVIVPEFSKLSVNRSEPGPVACLLGSSQRRPPDRTSSGAHHRFNGLLQETTSHKDKSADSAYPREHEGRSRSVLRHRRCSRHDARPAARAGSSAAERPACRAKGEDAFESSSSSHHVNAGPRAGRVERPQTPGLANDDYERWQDHGVRTETYC